MWRVRMTRPVKDPVTGKVGGQVGELKDSFALELSAISKATELRDSFRDEPGVMIEHFWRTNDLPEVQEQKEQDERLKEMSEAPVFDKIEVGITDDVFTISKKLEKETIEIFRWAEDGKFYSKGRFVFRDKELSGILSAFFSGGQ